MIVSILSNLVGYPYDQLQYAVCIISCYFFAYFFRKFDHYNKESSIEITNEWKHVYSIFLSLTLSWYCFGYWSFVHTFTFSYICYLIHHYLNFKYRKLIVFIFCLTYLSILQFRRMYYHYMVWTTDMSGIIMLMTIKMTSYSFNESDKTKIPKLIEWLGHTYFFPTFFTGPVISFEEYVDFCNKDLKHTENFKEAVKETHQPIIRAICMLGAVFLTKKYPVFYSLTNEFGEWSILRKIKYMYFSMFFLRCRYYFAWFLAEANGLMIGLTEKQANNINIWNVELAENIREVLANWNIATAEWLKNHVYIPVINEGYSPTVATYTTNIVSAFWHGFYPGYYFTFLFGGILTKLGRDFYHTVWPRFKGTKLEIPYRISSKFIIMLLLIFGGTPFQIYGFNHTLVFYRNINYIGFFIITTGFIIVKVLRKNKKD